MERRISNNLDRAEIVQVNSPILLLSVDKTLYGTYNGYQRWWHCRTQPIPDKVTSLENLFITEVKLKRANILNLINYVLDDLLMLSRHFRRYILPFSKKNLPSLVTFDALHTLMQLKGINTHMVYCSLIKRKFNIDVNPLVLKPAYKLAWSNLKEEIPCYGINHGYSVDEWWYKFVDISLETSITDIEKRACISNYLVSELKKPEYWQLLDGAADVVKRLHNAGVELGIVSNCDDRLPFLLEYFGLQKYFEFVYTPMNTLIEKPNPEIFERVLEGRENLLTGNDFGVHIGDELMEDYIAPRQVGLMSILISNKHTHICIRDKVSSMRQLAEWLLRD